MPFRLSTPSLQKTFNDPVYGFISINDPLIFQLVDLPVFQRLRRISQLGLTHLVYSGATHSRFQHALGAMWLVKSALAALKAKGVNITEEEEQATKIAVLLHDIGHGPFSHALEGALVSKLSHEQVGHAVVEQLNHELRGALDLAIAIMRGQHTTKFLHQLVSSQLDVDRLDYLRRDSFFTGVSEGTVGAERIIKMLNVSEDELVVEEKALYSIEQFLMARRLMYWQVYLHKTVLSAEFLLLNVVLRARQLRQRGVEVSASKSLAVFLNSADELPADWISDFLQVDDVDVMSAIKNWTTHTDKVLAELCSRLVNRRLLKTQALAEPLSEVELEKQRQTVAQRTGWTAEECSYLVFQKSLSSRAYNPAEERIKVLRKDGTVCDIADLAAILEFPTLHRQEWKNYLYFPA